MARTTTRAASAGKTATGGRECKGAVREHGKAPERLRTSRAAGQGREKGPWAEAAQALEAFAKRHKLQTHTLTLPHDAAPAGTPRAFCRSVMEDEEAGITCVMQRRRRNGVCIYRCFPTPEGGWRRP